MSSIHANTESVAGEKVWIECVECSGSGKVTCFDCDGEGGRMDIPAEPKPVLHRWLIQLADGSIEYGRGDQPMRALQANERLWFTYRD